MESFGFKTNRLKKGVRVIQFRVENKYIVTDQELLLLRKGLSSIMRQDSHQNGDCYMIRSLYFDDQHDSYMNENDAGIDLRKKYRVRIYEPSQDKMRLELKEKIHGYTRKSSCTVTKQECLSLINKSASLLFDDRKLFNSLKLETRMAGLQPKIIIEYDRTAFVSSLGNIRITFDRNIRASTCCQDFFSADPHGFMPLLPRGLHVLEVKYDEVIPDYVLQIIQCINPQRTAFSKYYLGRHAVRGDFCYLSYCYE